MNLETKIKSTLVQFFREGTNDDYLDALNIAIYKINADVNKEKEEFKVINRKETGNSLASNLVYPCDDHGYRQVAKLDKEWVAEELLWGHSCTRIHNKYAIELKPGVIVYNHDGTYWLIQQNFEQYS